MSVERELGQLAEAVNGLKESNAEIRDSLKSLNGKFDVHLENYSTLKTDVAKATATVALIVSLLFTGVKAALAKLISNN